MTTTTTTTVTLAFVDDHPMILEGLLSGLPKAMPELKHAEAFRSLDELDASERRFDLVVLDLRLGDGSAPDDNVRRVVGSGHRTLMFTQEPRPAVVARCLEAGALGVVGKNKDMPEIVDAIRRARTGEDVVNVEWADAVRPWVQSCPDLSAREREALELYATGLPVKSVARRMGIAESTVQEHLSRVRRKYADVGRDAPTKTALYQRAVEDGYIDPPGLT